MGNLKGTWRTYTIKDGLPSALIYTIMQDSKGYVWIGTAHGGLCRYDGIDFETFTKQDGLPSNSVCRILEDSFGNLWFGTPSGISRYDYKEFQNFCQEWDGGEPPIIQWIIERKSGEIWFATEFHGVLRYDGERVKTVISHQELQVYTEGGGVNAAALAEDKLGNLWVATWNGGVLKYDGERLTKYSIKDGLGYNCFKATLLDGKGNIWFGSWGVGGSNGVSRYDGEKFKNFTVEDGLAHNKIYWITEDSEGLIWFCTENGVSVFDGESFQNIREEDGLPHNFITSAMQDRDGSLWFGTQGGGIARFDRNIQSFTVKDGLAGSMINAIYQDSKGNIWFATNGGVSKYDGERFETFTKADGLLSNDVFSIVEDKRGDIWLGTWNGVNRYDGTSFQKVGFEQSLGGTDVRSIIADADGNIWVAKGGGVMRYDGKSCKIFKREDGLIHNDISVLLEDSKGNIWFGAPLMTRRGAGVSRYDGEKFQNFTKDDGLASNAVTTIFEDSRENIWFGTFGGGVSRYDGKRFENLTIQDGLPANQVMAITEDSFGNLWFGTLGGGACRWDGIIFQNFTVQDGLANDAVTSILEDKQGNIWLGTYGDGVTRITPQKRRAPAQTEITAIIADKFYRNVDEVYFTENIGNVTFQFKGTRSFETRENNMVYLYRLVGKEKEWKVTREREARYAGLKPGDYTFQVKAVNRDLVYPQQPAAVRVEVTVSPEKEMIHRLQREVITLRRESRKGDTLKMIVGNSEPMRKVYSLIESAAASESTVFIKGETGVGKELVARLIHQDSLRKLKPFVPLNSVALSSELLESELFGHAKGAFTGAVWEKQGLVEVANGGTLFLDEIGNASWELQDRLLRFLDSGEFRRVGDNRVRYVDVRVIAATNEDLKNLISLGKFREALYYRLNALLINVPPLRERRDDIPLLVHHFLQQSGEKYGKSATSFSRDAMESLLEYNWPGNVRQLENAVDRAVSLTKDGEEIRLEHLPEEVIQSQLEIGIIQQNGSFSQRVSEFKRRLISKALEESEWNQSKAAKLLGLHRTNLIRMMKSLNLC